MSSLALISAGVTAAVSAGAAVAAHVQANQQAAQQRGQAGDAAAAVAAAGTAQKGTNADTSQLNAGGAPAAVGANSGPASTLLTGSGGVANSALNLGGAGALGSNTLLGS